MMSGGSCEAPRSTNPYIPIQSNMLGMTTVAQYHVTLMSFDNVINYWDNRGCGIMALLQSRVNPKHCRVLTTRCAPQLRFSCNFELYSGFQVDTSLAIRSALTWKCVDYSKGPALGRFETFCAIFDNVWERDQCKSKMIEFASDPPNAHASFNLRANCCEHHRRAPILPPPNYKPQFSHSHSRDEEEGQGQQRQQKKKTNGGGKQKN